MLADILVKENGLVSVASACVLPCDEGMNYDAKAFARRLQEAIDTTWPNRKTNDKGQASLSKITGLPQGQISHMLAGRREPVLSTIALIAERLNISLDWLVFGSGTMRRPSTDVDALAIEVRELRAAVEARRSTSDTPAPVTSIRTAPRSKAK